MPKKKTAHFYIWATHYLVATATAFWFVYNGHISIHTDAKPNSNCAWRNKQMYHHAQFYFDFVERCTQESIPQNVMESIHNLCRVVAWLMVTTTSAWWLLMPWCYCAFMSGVISDNHDDVGTIITIDILFPRNVHIYAFNNTYKQLKSSMCIQRYMYHLVTARETTASLSKLAAFRLNSTWLGHELYITKCKIKRQ